VTHVQVLLAGGLVGVLYGALRVASPAPPPVALFGLLGMVLGQSLLEAVL
jgi:XapX domain-containing protein